MSYHGNSSSSSNARRTSSRVNTGQTPSEANTGQTPREMDVQRQAAPGFHYMPDGTLMSDADHARLSGGEDGGCHGASAGKIQANSSVKSGIPVFRICSYNLVTTYGVTATQNPIPVIYNASNPWMISAWTDVANSTLYPSSFINYFNQIEAQTGPLVPGDKIAMDNNVLQPNGTTNSNGGGVCLSSISGGAVSGIANKFCLEYLGDYVPTNYPPNFPSVPIGNYSWNGNFLATAASIHIFSKFDCCKSFIQLTPPSTWDCVTKAPNIGEVSPNNLFNTFGGISQCVERFVPQVGAFPTLQACEASCSSGGPINTPAGPLPKLTNLDLDYSDIKQSGEKRSFKIEGDNGAKFRLEIKNEDASGSYYNFYTNSFSSEYSFLEGEIKNGSYRGSIAFPAVLDNDHYDISLFALENTKHSSNLMGVDFFIVKFGDGSIDINSSRGSSSDLLQKIIYQYTVLTLTLSGYSSSGDVSGTMGTSTLTVDRGAKKEVLDFSFTVTAAGTAAYRVLRQPTPDDLISFVQPTVDTVGLTLPGEDIFAGVARSSDKVVDGDFSGGATNITMDDDIGVLWAVGDRVTGNAILDAKTGISAVTITHINVGSNAKVFTISESIAIANNEELTFTEPRYKRWGVDTLANVMKEGMIVVPTTAVQAGTKLATYDDFTLVDEGTFKEKKVRSKKFKSVDKKSIQPTVQNGLITAQEGEIIFDTPQRKAIGGTTLKIGGYGLEQALLLFGYDVDVFGLAVTLTAPTTTTTEAIAANAVIAVADREGVINNVSRVSGIGMGPAAENPLITSGGGADGAGDWTMGVAQTLESGVELTIHNTGRIATITGKIIINKAGVANQTLRVDVDGLLSTSA